MSPRAAWRLERFGYGPVYDYAPGKVDWLAAGLPTEGAKRQRRAVDALEEPLTCGPTTTVAEAVETGSSGGTPGLLVVNDEGILLGLLRLPTDASPHVTVEEAMEPGPVTLRANEPLDPLLEHMAEGGVTEVVVTTPDGQLLGVIRR